MKRVVLNLTLVNENIYVKGEEKLSSDIEAMQI